MDGLKASWCVCGRSADLPLRFVEGSEGVKKRELCRLLFQKWRGAPTPGSRRSPPSFEGETRNWKLETGKMEWKLVLSQLQGLRKDVDPVTGREFRLLRMDDEKAIGCRHPD